MRLHTPVSEKPRDASCTTVENKQAHCVDSPEQSVTGFLSDSEDEPDNAVPIYWSADDAPVDTS